jgi:hypothetical protein
VLIAGFIGVGLTLVVSFFTPDNINVGNNQFYHGLQCLGFIIMVTPPLVMKILKKA